VKHNLQSNKFIAGLLIFFYSIPSFSIDQYYKFPEKSYKGYVDFEKSRNFCVFSFLPKSNDVKYEYLIKGISALLISGLRDISYIYVDSPKPQVVYHSFGNNPTKTLKEIVDEDSQNSKKKKREIADYKDLEDLNNNKKTTVPEKDPRHLKFELIQLTDVKPPKKEDSFALANKYNCDYVLTGSFEISGDSLTTEVSLFRENEGNSNEFKHTTSLIRAYQEMDPLVSKIRDQMYGKQTTVVEISTPDIENALVYLNGVYLGKAPLSNKRFPIGKASLFVYKEGYLPFRKEVDLQKDTLFKLSVRLEQQVDQSFLSVSANEEADVYLGIRYLGKTPLERVSVPSGMNRLRVSKEGFIDEFRPVELEKGEEQKITVGLRPGKTDIYYKNKKYVFLDHSYKDFSTYSLYGALLFYASYVYFNYASNKAYEAARPQVSLVNASVLTNFYANNPNDFALWYYYQNQVIDEATDRGKDLKRIAGTLPIENRRDRQFVLGPMVAGIGLMLVSAVTFYALGIDDETIDIGFVPVQTYGTDSTTQRDSFSYIQFNSRF